MTANAANHPGGFSLVEVVIAVVILAFGVLAMAASTAYMTTQVRGSDLSTERAMILQRTVETLRSRPFDRVISATERVGSFDIATTVTDINDRLKGVQVVITGPAVASGSARSATVADTFTFRISAR